MAGAGEPRRFHQPDHRHLDRRLSLHRRAALIAFGDMSTPLTLAFVLIVVALLGRNHAAVVQILGSPLIAVIMLLFIISLTTHMRIGMQVIIEDYVHDEAR